MATTTRLQVVDRRVACSTHRRIEETMPATTLRATTRVASTTTTTGRNTYGRVTGKRAHTTLIVRRSTGGETTAASTEASTKEEDGKPAPPEMKSEVRIFDSTKTTRFVSCVIARARRIGKRVRVV